jgi:hypothetical protein
MRNYVEPVVGREEAGWIVKAGLDNPITLFLLVIGLLLAVAVIVWAVFYAPQRRKDRYQARLDRQQEQDFRIQELELKRKIEESRATQSTQIAETAACFERTTDMSSRVLALSEKHLETLARMSELGRCRGGGDPNGK